MNILDKVISLASPKVAMRRVANRAKAQLLEMQIRRYEGAATGRRHNGWFSRGGQSVNQVINNDHAVLVQRSRELYMNEPYAHKAPYSIANNVVGTGIIPSPVLVNTADGVTVEKSNDEVLKKVTAAWQSWGETSQCDYDGESNFYALQHLAMKTVVLSGEVFLIRKRVKTDVSPLGIQLKMLEGDYIDTTKNEEKTSSGGYILYGVEFDKNLKKSGYWVWDRLPSESSSAVSSFVPVADIIHVYDVERAGQTRGVPAASPSLLKQRDLADYADAELLGKKTSSCMPIFVTNGEVEAATQQDDERVEHVEPGTINYLKAGEQVTFATPPPNNGYADFTRTNHRAVAASYLMSYEQFTGDLSNVNFSSGRMGWLEFQRQVENWQYLLIIPKFCEKAYKWFAEAVILSAGISNVEIKAEWTAPRRQMIDPVKETNAKKLAIISGLQSWQETVRQDGYDPKKVLAEMKQEQDWFNEFGVFPDINPLSNTELQIKVNGSNQQQTQQEQV